MTDKQELSGTTSESGPGSTTFGSTTSTFGSTGGVFGPFGSSSYRSPFTSSTSPLFVPSNQTGTSQNTHGEMVHVGVGCWFCGKSNIRGVRYKCIQCASYDRCSACMASPKAWASHHPNHQFFPVYVNGELGDYNAVKHSTLHWTEKSVHHGVRCDGCAKVNIQGVRHRCLQCDDFDFCEKCLSDPKQRETHHPAHPFFPIVSLFDKSAYDRARALFQAHNATVNQTQLPRHFGTHCDACMQNPIVGVRHKCFDCLDYDLCAQCIADPLQRSKHSLKHAFFPIPTPGGITQYETAAIIRNTS